MGENHTEIPIFGVITWGQTFQAGSQNTIHHHDLFVFNKHLKPQRGLLNSLLEWKGHPRGAAYGTLAKDVSHHVEVSAVTHIFLSRS